MYDHDQGLIDLSDVYYHENIIYYPLVSSPDYLLKFSYGNHFQYDSCGSITGWRTTIHLAIKGM